MWPKYKLARGGVAGFLGRCVTALGKRDLASKLERSGIECLFDTGYRSQG